MLFKKSYDQIVAGFTKVEKDLRDLEKREMATSVKLDRQIVELKGKRNVSLTESARAGMTADKLADFFGKEEVTNES